MLAAFSVLAGAAAVDVTPEKFPVIVNGMFLSRTADKAFDPVFARALVLDDRTTRLAIVVVDSCMMPRELLDRAKDLAYSRTGIPPGRILISATHTHSAPAAMGCLGTDADEAYVKFLPPRIAEAIALAAARLEPARIGWGAVDDFDHTYCRRWIFRPDRMLTDPFGQRTVRANMHPGYQNPDAIAPSGPVDPQLSLLSVQAAADGRPLALLANYSMHYFSAPFVSADYFGLFSSLLAPNAGVVMMSQGTSGDQMWRDYGGPKPTTTLEAYAGAVAGRALEAYRAIAYRTDVTLAMAEARLTLRRRVPDTDRLAWARSLLAGLNGGLPRSQPEVYAREQVFLAAEPARELKLQALRIGDVAITAIPNEVFALTGLKLKALSPLAATFNISLANGSEGYIPPPEQHLLGGYTTWPARTAALETQAEPRIVETLVGLLETVSGARRRPVPDDPPGSYRAAVLHDRPAAYWPFSEWSGDRARDMAPGGRHAAQYEGGVAFYLPGRIHRAVHLAGGRVTSRIDTLRADYTAEFWFWNGLPNDARPVTATLFQRGEDSLTIGGAAASPGKLRFANLTGTTTVSTGTWRHVAIVRSGPRVTVYLDGQAELTGAGGPAPRDTAVILGAALEGRIDDAAVYGRALKAADIARHYRAAGSPTTAP